MIKSSRNLIIEEIQKISGFSFKKKDIQICLILIIDFLIKELQKNKIVSIKNFGIFSVVFTKQHIVNNLLTKDFLVPSFKNVKFYPSPVMKNFIQLVNNINKK